MLFQKSVFFIFIITCSFSLKSESYVNGDIHFEDGEVISAKIELPISNRIDIINYKIGDGEYIEVNANKIDVLTLKGLSGKVVLKRTQYYKNGKNKLTKHKFWAEIRKECSSFTTFVHVHKYEANSYGDLSASYIDGVAQHMIQRKGEDYPTGIGYVSIRKIITQKMLDKQRKKILRKYFTNDPDALSFVNSKKRVSQFELNKYLNTLCENNESESL